MAEVYGVKPKKFTKEWWPYFWMYYKWHTIALAVITVFIASMLFDCVAAEKYDLVVTYMGRGYITQSQGAELETELESVISDADLNGEVNAFYLALNLSDTQIGSEMDLGMEAKHSLDFADIPNGLYIYDSKRVEELSRNPELTASYLAASEWTTAGDAESGVFVSVKDSTLLKGLGVDSSDMYIAVRRPLDEADDEDKAVFDNAVRAAELLIK